MISQHREKFSLALIVTGAVLSVVTRATSPPLSTEDPFLKDAAYASLSTNTAIQWYYDSYKSSIAGRIDLAQKQADMEKLKYERVRNAVQGTASLSSGNMYLDMARLNQRAKYKGKSDEEAQLMFLKEKLEGSLGTGTATPAQQLVFEGIIKYLEEKESDVAVEQGEEEVALAEEDKSSLEQKKDELVEKMESKTNINTGEIIKNFDKKDRGFNFNIFKLRKADDEGSRKTEDLSLNEKFDGKVIYLARGYGDLYAYDYLYQDLDGNPNDYEFVDDTDYSDTYYSNDYNYNKPESVNTYTKPKRAPAQKSPTKKKDYGNVNADNYQDQLKEYQSGLSASEKQKLMNNRQKFQKYESYKNVSSPQDLNKLMGDEDLVDDIMYDVGSSFYGEEEDGNKLRELNDIFSGQQMTPENLKDFQNNNKYFKDTSNVYDKVNDDSLKELKYPDGW